MGDDSPAAAMPTQAAVSGDESDHVRGDDGERQIGFAASNGPRTLPNNARSDGHSDGRHAATDTTQNGYSDGSRAVDG